MLSDFKVHLSRENWLEFGNLVDFGWVNTVN